jgi:GTP-binding protein HflX
MTEQWLRLHPESLAVSAKTGAGLDDLADLVEKSLTSDMEEMTLAVPYAEYALIPLIRREGTVLEETTGDDATVIRCRIPRRLTSRVEKYRQQEGKGA